MQSISPPSDLPDKRQTVSDMQHHGLDPAVGQDVFVEFPDANGFGVLIARVHRPVVPEYVVCGNQAVRAQSR